MKPFVTVYECMAGWKAVLMFWDDEIDGYAPWQTGFFGYPTREQAIRDAVEWAASEEIALRV